MSVSERAVAQWVHRIQAVHAHDAIPLLKAAIDKAVAGWREDAIEVDSQFKSINEALGGGLGGHETYAEAITALKQRADQVVQLRQENRDLAEQLEDIEPRLTAAEHGWHKQRERADQAEQDRDKLWNTKNAIGTYLTNRGLALDANGEASAPLYHRVVDVVRERDEATKRADQAEADLEAVREKVKKHIGGAVYFLDNGIPTYALRRGSFVGICEAVREDTDHPGSDLLGRLEQVKYDRDYWAGEFMRIQKERDEAREKLAEVKAERDAARRGIGSLKTNNISLRQRVAELEGALRDICNMQQRLYGDGIKTHCELEELTRRADHLLATPPQQEGERDTRIHPCPCGGEFHIKVPSNGENQNWWACDRCGYMLPDICVTTVVSPRQEGKTEMAANAAEINTTPTPAHQRAAVPDRAAHILKDMRLNHVPRIVEGIEKGYPDENQILVLYDHAVRARLIIEAEQAGDDGGAA